MVRIEHAIILFLLILLFFCYFGDILSTNFKAEDASAEKKQPPERTGLKPVLLHASSLREDSFEVAAAPQMLWYSPQIGGSRVWPRALALFDTAEGLAEADPAMKKEIRRRCSNLSQLDALKDRECHAYWLYQLNTAKIVGVDLMLGFSKGKRNAFRVQLEGGIQGWYKVCPGEGEDPHMELVSYLLDHILGFHRMAPVVSRSLRVKDLEAVTDNQDFLSYIAQTDYVCMSRDGYLNGVMIGWWNNLEDTASPFRKKEAAAKDVLHYRDHWNEVVVTSTYPIQELPRNHIFMYLLSILQHPGHNEFRVEDGPLVVVDVDRAIFDTAKKPKDKDMGISFLCKFDRPTFNTLVSFYSGSAPSQESLPGLLVRLLQHLQETEPFTEKQAYYLQKRVDYLVKMVNECIQVYGEEDVLYNYDW